MEVVDTGSLAVQRVWAPVNHTDRYYVGQLVGWQQGTYDGVVVAGAAGAQPDATVNICGIIEAIDTLEPLQLNDTVAKGSYVDSVTTVAAQAARQTSPTSARGNMWPYGDKSVHVKIALLTPWTKVSIPIYNGAFGVAPTELNVTTAGTTGLIGGELVTDACDFTPVVDTCAIYCRAGNNKGVYRNTDDTSTTVPTCDIGTPNAVEPVGSTYVRVPVRTFGSAPIVLDAESLYIDAASTSASSYYNFNVIELHLEELGKEHAVGFFASRHFDTLA
jgi:hypothetical protein